MKIPRKNNHNLSKSKKKIKMKNSVKVKSISKTKIKYNLSKLDKCSGRHFTVSIALPGSILQNAQSPPLKTYLAGQVARACVVFQVDEIIVYDDSSSLTETTTDGKFDGITKQGDPNILMARLLQYMECPQYLRKFFFPRHPDLKFAGVLNPLDSPHHMRKGDSSPFREGIVLEKQTGPNGGSLVNCGMHQSVEIDRTVDPGMRVTIRLPNEKNKDHPGSVVSPDTPREEQGIYWGYTVRLAGSLSQAINECPYKDSNKYDLTIGTSERGDSVDNFHLPPFKHLLVVFGGLPGLESGLKSDKSLKEINDPRFLFNHYLNTCPKQGSRTIRTEEAILITMSSLRPHIESHYNRLHIA